MQDRRPGESGAWAGRVAIVFAVGLACAGSARANPPGTTKPAARTDVGHAPVAPACAYPHPLITEVLYAVPTVGEADANKDGKRDVAGDEFFELVNPHDKSIDLRGYTITDGSPNPKSQIRFTFPSMSLPARGVVVVFNGHGSKIPGPVGDAKRTPTTTNEHFGRCAVFSMKMSSTRIALSNTGDAVCLKAPDGKCLQRVRWGKADEKAGGTGFVIDEVAPVTSAGSVQRQGIGKDAPWKSHADLDAAAFSPGVFAISIGASPAPVAPEVPATPTSPKAAVPAKPETPPSAPGGTPAPEPEPAAPATKEDQPQRSKAKKPAGAPKF